MKREEHYDLTAAIERLSRALENAQKSEQPTHPSIIARACNDIAEQIEKHGIPSPEYREAHYWHARVLAKGLPQLLVAAFSQSSHKESP